MISSAMAAEWQNRASAHALSARWIPAECARVRCSIPPVDHTHMVRRMLTLMLVLVRSASLGLELGAHLLEELRETSAWRCLPRRAHAAMRVVHDCSWLVSADGRNSSRLLQ